MDEFTERERMTLEEIYKKDLQNLTPDEVALYARWQIALALNDDEHRAKIDAISQSMQAKIKASEAVSKAARKSLRELKEASIKRLSVLRNGQEK